MFKSSNALNNYFLRDFQINHSDSSLNLMDQKPISEICLKKSPSNNSLQKTPSKTKEKRSKTLQYQKMQIAKSNEAIIQLQIWSYFLGKEFEDYNEENT